MAAASIVLLVASACTDGENVGDQATTTTGPRHEWCDVLESLDLPEDAADVDLAAAPTELEVLLHHIAWVESQVEALREEGFVSEVKSSSAVSAETALNAWGHENCGGRHPFCHLWESLDEIFAASTTEYSPQTVVRVLDDDLLRYAPDQHLGAVKDHLVSLHTLMGVPVPSDYGEDDAELARAELDDWVRSSC